jgi:hypothetical protein
MRALEPYFEHVAGGALDMSGALRAIWAKTTRISGAAFARREFA